MTFNSTHAYIIRLSQKDYGSIAAVLHNPQAVKECTEAGLLDATGQATAKGKAAVEYWIENGTYNTATGCTVG